MQTQLYLTPKDQGRPLTREEFSRAAGAEGYRYELIDGRLEVSPLPELPHDCLRDWLARKLWTYAQVHPEVVNEVKAPARLFATSRTKPTAPEPDVAAFRDFPHDLPIAETRWQDLVPILAVEIISEDTADKDLVRNVELYQDVPTLREYWIVDPRPTPDQPSLIVYRRRGARWQKPITVPFGETYTTKLLPDFALVVDPRA